MVPAPASQGFNWVNRACAGPRTVPGRATLHSVRLDGACGPTGRLMGRVSSLGGCIGPQGRLGPLAGAVCLGKAPCPLWAAFSNEEETGRPCCPCSRMGLALPAPASWLLAPGTSSEAHRTLHLRDLEPGGGQAGQGEGLDVLCLYLPHSPRFCTCCFPGTLELSGGAGGPPHFREGG